MDERAEVPNPGPSFRNVFQSFVCVSLTALLGLHVYAYLAGTSEAIEGDFNDVKYVVSQLSKGLSEVNQRHESLRNEIERISTSLPSVTAATNRAKAALTASFCRNQAVDVHDYDRQIVDYALESAGGRVLDTGDTVEHVVLESPMSYALYTLTSLMCRGTHCLSARAMLQPGALPGECWAFRGHRGEAIIRLLGTVQITGVSLEHIPPHISPTREISSAPRKFKLEGLTSRSDPHPHDFGTFEYDQRGKPIQYYEVKNPTTRGFHLVRLRVLSNWGHPVFTCVYRLRVHGDLLPGQTPKPSDEELMRIDNE